MAEITINDTHARLQSAQILDVRENVEIGSGMIPGALHLPMSELPARVDQLE